MQCWPSANADAAPLRLPDAESFARRDPGLRTTVSKRDSHYPQNRVSRQYHERGQPPNSTIGRIAVVSRAHSFDWALTPHSVHEAM